MPSPMLSFKTNDNVVLKYLDTGTVDPGNDESDTLILARLRCQESPIENPDLREYLIQYISKFVKPHAYYGTRQIHGFTGSSAVWKRNIPALSKRWRVIAPDLRGHGESGKPKNGYHVSRLAMDLRELLIHLVRGLDKPIEGAKFKVLGGSLGCSILWSYAELFTTAPFSHMIFVDQSPLQNSTLDGWDSRFCNRAMNTAPAVAALQTTLSLSPETAHRGTIAACLAYRSHPYPTDNVSLETLEADEQFFLTEALKGNGEWYGKLMADHTSLDWRDSISATFGPHSNSKTQVLVVASNRSGCFPAEGPMVVVDLVNGYRGPNLARGVVVDWGGHWCYWEDPERFNELVLGFLVE